MRSHPPSAPAPPLPPLLDRLSTYLPNAGAGAATRRRSAASGSDDDEGNGAVVLADLDPATSRLLPRRPRPHRVRVQGRLAVVRSVSVAHLRGPGSPRSPPSSSSSSASGPVPSRSHDGVVGSRRRPPRRSLDDGGRDDDDDDDDEAAARDVRKRDAQLRGYGIGGAGNIRRPTDVIGTSTREPSGFASLFSSAGARSAAEEKRWRWTGFLDRAADRKGKGAARDGAQGR